MSLCETNSQVCRRILNQGWIRFLDWQRQLDSTNQQAKRWLAESGQAASLPALFVADLQSAGRGRGENVWWSPEGCLMFTLAIGSDSMRQSPQQWSQLALVAAAAVAECVANFLPEKDTQVALKWPNDTYLAGRKCSGILVESGAGGARLIGIGINVQVDFSQAPAEVRQRATSMHEHRYFPQSPGHNALLQSDAKTAGAKTADAKTRLASEDASGRILDKGQVLVDVVGLLQQYILEWSRGQATWLAAWQRRCLLSGKILNVRCGDGRRLSGTCQGIDSQGCLVLQTPAGVACIASAEVLSWHSKKTE